jgi:hypothetical protein
MTRHEQEFALHAVGQVWRKGFCLQFVSDVEHDCVVALQLREGHKATRNKKAKKKREHMEVHINEESPSTSFVYLFCICLIFLWKPYSLHAIGVSRGDRISICTSSSCPVGCSFLMAKR